MFKIMRSYDWRYDNPIVEKRYRGWIIECGYNCRNSCWCEYASKCKHKSSYKWHNFSVSVRTFFKYRLNIDFRFPIYFQRHSVDLSGTTKCRYNVPRHYTCHDCNYSRGYRECANTERHKMMDEGRFEELEVPNERYALRCTLFDPNQHFIQYDKNTGEYLW